MHTVLVAAGVLVEGARVLVTQRRAGTHLAGIWEFPGGKVLPGEDPRGALRRELLEELGLDVEVGEILDVTFHRYEDVGKTVLLLFFDVTRAAGSVEPRAIEVASLAWAGRDDLAALRFPPADTAVLAKVRARLLAAGERPR
jgi:8-oxo-dGTP diphosphatase